MRDFFLMMTVQFVAYLNLVINYRAIAHNQIPVAMVTDGLAVIISIFIIKRVSGTKEPWIVKETGMVIGGSMAALVGMSLTQTWG